MATMLIMLLCCTLFINKAFCQDIITRTDSVRIEANILEMGNDQIRYRLYGSPDSSEYIISTLDVLAVAFADGSRRVFAQQAMPRHAAHDPNYAVDWGRNVLSFNLTDLLFRNFTLGYERIAASGKVGIKVPLSWGLDPREENYHYSKRDKTFSAGLQLHLYPFGQGRFSYYAGPQAELAFANYYSYIYDNNDPYAVPQQLESSANIFSLALSNGVYYQFSKLFVAALDVGVGVRAWSKGGFENDYDPFYVSRFFIPANLQVGCRF